MEALFDTAGNLLFQYGLRWLSNFNDYVALLILRNRGIGYGEKLLTKALAQHFCDQESTITIFQSLYHHRPHLRSFIDFLQSQSSRNCSDASISTLYPVLPGMFCDCALCSPLSSLHEAEQVVSLGGYLAEWKYDGVRIQIHRTSDGIIRLFGRSGEVLLNGKMII